ncbi:MAG: oligosaccharide flippase family protein [Gammaproteobacteria bacterium]|nr:oligosaccharide flippase family protein [Gammaproteobacteria bacterium]
MSARRDAYWTVAATLVGAFVQLLQLAVASRFLSPAEFGLLAIVNVTLWIVMAFQDMGLSSYCVHLGEVSRRIQSTLFWMSSLLGAIAATFVASTASYIADFYQMPLLNQLLPLVAVNFLILGLGAQYQANLIRTFGASRLAKIEVGSRLISFILTMGLLVQLGLGTKAIVLGTIAFSAFKFLAMAMVAESHWHPRLMCDRTVAKNALVYGGYQAGSQIINQLRTQLDQLIVGKALGAEALGIYSLAKELISYPLRILQPLVSRLVLPHLAKVQNDISQLKGIFINGLKRTAILSGVVYALLAFFSPWAVEILYGASYYAVAGVVPLLAIFGVLRPLGLNAGMLAQALGRTDREFRWNMICALVSLPLLLLVAVYFPRIEAFALALSFQQVLLTLLAYQFFVKPLAAVGIKHYVGAWLVVLLITLIFVVLAFVVDLPSLASIWAQIGAFFGS